jgi:hypothetical protein
LGPGKFVKPFHDEQQVDVALDLFTRMRQPAGPDIDLMIDCGAFLVCKQLTA